MSDDFDWRQSVTCSADIALVQYEMDTDDMTSPRLLSPMMYQRIFAAYPNVAMIFLVDEEDDPRQSILMDVTQAAGQEIGLPLRELRHSTLQEIFGDEAIALAPYLWQAKIEQSAATFTARLCQREWDGIASYVDGVVLAVLWPKSP